MAIVALGAFAGGLRQRHRAWRTLRAFLFLFNLHTLLLCAITCAFTAYCASRGWSYDIDSQQFVMAVPFPLTFALTQAFGRRERVLTFIAELKASCVSLFFAYRDFPQAFPPPGAFPPGPGGPSSSSPGHSAPGAPLAGPRYPQTLGDNENPWAREARALIMEFLVAVRDYLSAPRDHESVGEARLLVHGRHYFRELLFGGPSSSSLASRRGSRARLLQPTASLAERVRRQAHEHPGHDALMRVYGALSRLSVLNECMSQAARYGRGGEGGASRTAQYQRFMAAQFEQLRTVCDYRTPSLLRSCCSVLIHIALFALAPYFVHRGSCQDWGPGPRGEGPYTGDGMCLAPYANAVFFVVVSMLLLNVQASAEYPFDADGVDDIFFELDQELWDVATQAGPVGPVSVDGSLGGGEALFGPTVEAARALEAEMVRLASAAARGGGAARDE